MLGATEFKTLKQNFPGGTVVKKKKKSTCQCRRHGFDPWFGKIPHAPKQLKPMHHKY